MKIILDFDYTLLDTEKFKKKLAVILGVDWQRYITTYKESIICGNYRFDVHLAKLGIDNAITRKKVNGYLKNIDEYLHKGAIELIKSFIDSGDEVIILTKGDRELQQKKLKNSQIGKLCQIIFVDKAKELALNKIKEKFNNDKVLIINDNYDEARKMKAIIPTAEVFITQGPYAKNAKNEKIYTIKELNKKFFPKTAKIL